MQIHIIAPEMAPLDLLICRPGAPGEAWQIRERTALGNCVFWRYANNRAEAENISRERTAITKKQIFIETNTGKRVVL